MSLLITRHTSLKRGVCGHSLLAHPPTGCVGGSTFVPPQALILMDFANGVFKSGANDVDPSQLISTPNYISPGGGFIQPVDQPITEILGDFLDAITGSDGFTIVYKFNAVPRNGNVARYLDITQFGSGAEIFIEQGGVSPFEAAYHAMRVQHDDGSYAELYPSSDSNAVVKQAWNFSPAGAAVSMAGSAVLSNHNAQSIVGGFNHAFMGGPNSFSTPGENNFDGFTLQYIAVYPLQAEADLPKFSS